ncbi:MAG: cell surface protein SprA [Bacteroidales bacterium]
MVRFIKRIHIFFVSGIISLFILLTYVSSASGTAFIIDSPLDSIDSAQTVPPLRMPIPEKSENAFEQKMKESTGFRLEPSPEVYYDVSYNADDDEYVAQKMIGEIPVGAPQIMTPQEFFQFSAEQRKKEYWNQRATANRRGDESDYKPDLDFFDNTEGGFFEENKVDIVPQGAAELTFGFRHTNNRNPRFTRKQQRSTQPEFDTKIQMSVTGSIGDKMSLVVKYDTEAQFEFEREIKLEYEGDEDEIIKKIEFGDVSMPLSSSLITGSQSLFGVKSELQFGKLFVTGVFSRQQGDYNSVSVQGGAEKKEFEVRSDNYEQNKHYFLSHYFREQYEDAFENSPEISSGIIIRKVEVWVSQTSAGNENARNILALTDIGDSYTNDIDGKVYKTPKNRDFYTEIKNLQGIREISNISTLMQGRLEQGRDYAKVEQAVLLDERQYDVNTKLGYISLRSQVQSSRILGVSFEYEYKGEIYQVGEFSNDGIDHPEVLIVKQLKSAQSNPSYNNWDLMMKNVYSIGGYQISKNDFELHILYEDDRTGTPIPYLTEGDVKGENFLSLYNLDNITVDNMPYPDGLFDFIDGYTIDASRGIIIFPVLEPFGSYLEEKIGDDDIAQKYVYTELYDSTQSAARQVASKNKFLLSGSYKSDVSSEIFLNATQIQEGSVTVTAGGRQLVEGSDYTVDYMGGSVKIINEGLLQSDVNIDIQFESNPLFSMKTKTFMGTHLDYRYSKNINFGATLLRLNEQPMVQKVGFDDYPINNTIWGLNATYSDDVYGITRFVDKYVPFVTTKEESSVQLSGEFAQLVPDQSKYISDAVELDNFENTEGRIYLREPSSWKIASTPQGQKDLFPEGEFVNNRAFRYNAAHISWYDINRSFYTNNSDVSKTVQQQPFSRPVQETDLFPNKDVEVYNNLPMSLLNLSYYPNERGQYNYDAQGLPGISSGLDTDGSLKNPKSRWGGVMVSLNTTDFEETNVEYIEFWLMDPFEEDTADSHSGGDLYINLGRMSEDVLRDGRKSAEHGLVDNIERYDETEWGRVPNYLIVETGFNNNIDRSIQDVGLDGLSDDDEQRFFAEYLDEVEQIVDPEVYEEFLNDPSADNFYSYTNNRGIEKDIVWRYKYFSNVDGNSPEGNTEGISSYQPDIEDVNGDNTLQESEAYYQYHISLRKQDLEVGKNFIVDDIVEVVDNKEVATWYQFKIPITTEEKERIGDISDFRDIPFMRMFLRDFEDSVILRIAKFSMVYSSWRRYTEPLYEPGEYDIYNDSEFDVSVVSIEQNSNRTPINYVLPPSVDRVVDPMSTSMQELNESALECKVEDLDDGNSKAVYKNFNKDLRQFGRMEMFIHAEKLINEQDFVHDGDLVAFIRIGSDFTDNYYEYEIPLTFTEHEIPGEQGYNNNSHNDRLMVWPEENKLSIDLSVFTDAKLERDEMMNNGIISDLELYHTYSVLHGDNKVTVKGSPSISNVRTIMLGVRNPKKSSRNTTDDGLAKSGIVWFNELRLTDINEQGGWAAIASARVNVADFATLSLAGKTSKPGFGSIDQKVFDRSMETLYQYDVASNVSLHKFFPEDWGLNIPFYADVSEIFIRPQYDPTNPDILLDQSLDNLYTESQRDSLLDITEDYTRSMSYNFTNVKIANKSGKQGPFNISNISTNYAYSTRYMRNVDYIKNYNHKYAFGLNYNYTMRPKNYTPFKKSNIRLVRDFNFYLLPRSVMFKNDWERVYKEQQRRNMVSYIDMPVLASKWFDWNRTYAVKYNVAKNLKLSYDAVNYARIDEPEGVINKSDEDVWEDYKEEVWSNIQHFGQNQQFSQKVSLNYKIPIDKIAIFNWVNSNYKYSGTYNWERGPELASGQNFGNTIKNSNSKSLNTNLNLTRLYQKSDYLKAVERRMRRKGAQAQRKETVKYEETKVSLTKNEMYEINHKLKTKDVRITVVDENGQLVQGQTKLVNDQKAEFTPVRDARSARIVVVGRRDVVESPLTRITDNLANLLMMTKSVSINYSVNEGTFIPGYKYSTEYIGLEQSENGIYNPGLDYVVGIIPHDLDNYLTTDYWIVDNDLISDKFKKTNSNQLRLQASLQPINNMRITLNSNRQYSNDIMRYLVGDAASNKENMQINGGFSITYNTILTSFNTDKAYNLFKENRVKIAHRLAKDKYGTVDVVDVDTDFPEFFSETSQDVLLPAFLSAYSGQDPENVYVDDYFVPMFADVKSFLRTLNWRLSYNGLSRLDLFKEYFRSININHSYSSSYDIGGYTSFTSGTQIDEYYINSSSGEMYLSPQYDVKNVSISERFNPLIGIDARLQNNVTGKLEIRNNRSVTLSFTNTEISENIGIEYVIGGGYVFDNFKVNINNKTYDNDLTMRLNFSVRDNKTIRRNIVEDVTRVISGTKVYSFESFADYMLNERFTVRVYLDYNINSPYTNGYKTSSLSGGINLRFSLI